MEPIQLIILAALLALPLAGLAMASVFGDLGPVGAVWDVDGTPVDLRPLHGGVEITDEVKSKEIFDDDHGEAPVDEVFTGRTVSVLVNMTRSSLAQLAEVIPSATVVGDVMTVKVAVGTQMRALAKKLTIKRVIDGVISTDTDNWITFPLAFPKGSIAWKFNNSDQRTTPVRFVCFPREDSGHVSEIWYIGQ